VRIAEVPLDVLARIIDPLRRPVLSSRYPAAPPLLAQSMRGLPEVDPARCERDAGCVVVCPTGAVALDEDSWAIDTGRCIFCAACAEACPTGAISLGSRVELARRERGALSIVTTLEKRP
jgi:formate hydrogenlyase subunit 6/NADH:ubiquinone oxidoreductase subunit I